MTKVSTVYRVGSLHLSEGVIFNFYPEKNSPFYNSFFGLEMKKDNHPLQVYGTSKKSVPEFGGSTPNLGETQEGNKVYIIVFYGRRDLRQEKRKVKTFLYRKHLIFLQVLFARNFPNICLT